MKNLRAAIEALEATPYRSGADETDDMCPNCVTPWKCNGPHESSEHKPDGYLIDKAAVLTLLDADPELDATVAAQAWHEAGHGQHGSPGADASNGGGWTAGHAWDDCPHRDHWLRKAKRFAREYAALAASQPEASR